MGKQRPIDLSSFDEVVTSKEIDLSAFDDIVKKNGSSQGSRSTSQLLNIGLNPFQSSQVDTKQPSVLTPKGKAEYQEQVKAFKPQEIAKEGQPKPPKKADGGGATAFMKGLNDFNSNVFKTPRLLYDAASSVTDTALQALNLQQDETNYDDIVAASGYTSPLSVLERLGDYYAGKSNQYAQRQEKFDKGIVDSFTSGDIKGGGKQLWNNIAESIPSMIGMAVTGGAGNIAKLKYAQKTLASALPFISGRNAELSQDESIPKPVRVVNATLNGLSEVIFDQSFGTQAMIGKVVDAFKNEGRDAAVKVAKDFTKGFASEAIKKIQPFTGTIKGAVEEMSTTLSQNLVDKYTINPDKDLMEGVFDSGLVGGVMTGGIGSIGTVAYSSSQKKQVGDLMKQRSELVDDLDNDNLPDDIKDDLSTKLNKVDEKISKIDDEGETRVSQLSDDDKKTIVEKEAKITSLEQALQDESLSETTKETLADRLLKEQDAVDEILTKPIEQLTPEPAKEPTPAEIEVEVTPEEISETIIEEPNVQETETQANQDNGLNTVTGSDTAVQEEVIPLETFKQFEDVINNTKNFEEAYKVIKNTQDVPKEIADAFGRKYNPNKDLLQKQAFAEYYNEVKAKYKEVVEPVSNPKENVTELKDERTELSEKEQFKQAYIEKLKDISPQQPAQWYDNQAEENWKLKQKRGESKGVQEPKVGDPLRKLADKIEQGKINKLGGFKASTGFDAVWDGSITVVAQSLRTGAKLADAIEAGLKYVRQTDWYKELTDKENFESQYKSHFEKEYASEEEVEPKPPKQEKEPVEDDDFDEDELNVMGITKKEARRIREELGEEQYQYDRKSRASLEAEADRLMAEGFSVPNLIKRITKGGLASDVEIELIRRYFTSLTARINDKPTPALLQERKDLMEALDLLKTRAGRTVQSFDGLIAVEDNLASFLEQESKYADLSEGEIEDLTKKYKQAVDALEKYKAKEEEAREKAVNKRVQQEIDKQRKANRPRGEVKEDFANERKKFVADFRVELKKIRGTYSAVFVPYQRELIALAPFVRKMVQSYVKEGIYDLKTIIKGIHDEFKEDFPELTEADIRDTIAGRYPNTRKTKNAKLAEIRDLERQAKLERDIENLEAGIFETRSPVEKRKKSDKIDELEKEIIAIKKRHPELTFPSKLEGRKTWYKNRIAELKGEIEKGDFDEIVAPEPILLDDEALRLKDEYIKFRDETRTRREMKEADAMSGLEKNIRKFRELAEIKRVVQTSIDVSIPLRQGVAIMLNPRTTKIGVEGYSKMLNTMFSEKKYNRLMYDIENNPEFLRSKDDGMVYTDLGSHNIELRDESHPVKGFIHRIPILGAGIKISERAAAAWTNYARFELYQRQVKMLLAQGKTRENAKKAYEDAAARVMTDTGRGKLPVLSDKTPSKTDGEIKKALGTVFYGARLYSSTFRKLNPLYYLNPSVDPTVRVEAFKDMIGYVGSQVIAHVALAALLGATVSFDYDEPDFLKLRIGKRVIDLTAGQSVYIRTFMRLLHAVIMKYDSDVSEADAKKYASFAGKSVGTFWRNKLAPNTSYAVSWYFGTNSIGEEFDPYEIIKIYPMYGEDLWKALNGSSPIDALYILPIGMSGLGYQEYSKDIRKARVSVYLGNDDKNVAKFLKNKKLNIQSQVNQELTDLDTGEPILMTKEQSDRYERVWSSTIIDAIKGDLKRLEGLDEDNLTKEIAKIKSKATLEAKEDIMGYDPKLTTIEIGNEQYKLTKAQVAIRQSYVNNYIRLKGRSTILVQRRKGKTQREAEAILESKAKADATDRFKKKFPKGRGLNKD